jgi:pyruvate/2-oxoglutarate dehydrogenase complex dihydrolipoamide acyltransferase (E2) component
MSVTIILPQLGFSMEDGKIAEWLADDGATVKKGQVIYSLETDKSVQEIEAEADGILRIHKEPGATYQVGTVLGVIE